MLNKKINKSFQEIRKDSIGEVWVFKTPNNTYLRHPEGDIYTKSARLRTGDICRDLQRDFHFSNQQIDKLDFIKMSFDDLKNLHENVFVKEDIDFEKLNTAEEISQFLPEKDPVATKIQNIVHCALQIDDPEIGETSKKNCIFNLKLLKKDLERRAESDNYKPEYGDIYM